MNRIRDLARSVLDNISVGNHIDIDCESCEGFNDVYILKIGTANRYATFEILDERLKMVSLTTYEGFAYDFVRQFQNLMIDELYSS